MRPVPLVVLFFGAMIGAALALHFAPPLVPLLLFSAVVGGAAIFGSSHAGRAVAAFFFVFSCAAVSGAVHLKFWRHDLPEGVVVVDAVVVDEAFVDAGQRVVVDVDRVLRGVGEAWQAAPLRLAVDLSGTAAVSVGDRLRLRGRIHEPTPALSPGTFDGEAYALSRGLHGRLSIDDAEDLAVVSHAGSGVFSEARRRLRDRLLSQLTPREAGLLLALLIGDTSLFEQEQSDAYRHVGAGHLLAVSGLQVTLLAVLLQRVFSLLLLLTPLGRRGAAFVPAFVCAVVGVWSFVFLCGCPPSAVRAGVMATFVCAAQALGRRVALVDVLGGAGLVTVLVSPTSILDAGFLLSYAAVLGLAAASSTSSLNAQPGLWTSVKPALIASLTAGLVTLPLSAWLFGQVAPAGLVANVFLVPIASILQLPALIGGALGAFLDLAWLSWLGAEAALLLESLVFGLADHLPGVRTIDAPSAVTALTLTTTALLTSAALSAKKPKWALAGVVVVVVALLLARREPAGLRVTFLPVGQGDGAVVEFEDGSVYVVDGGGRVAFGASEDERAAALEEPGVRVLVPFLKRRGIDTVDVMVLSHPHPDHAGGLRAVVDNVRVKQLWWAGDKVGGLVKPLIDKVPEVKSTPGLIGRFHVGDATVDVLAPAPQERTPTYPELGANDNSLVLRVCLRGGCVLFAGDVEGFGEGFLVEQNDKARLHSQVVKVPHHGSKTSSSPAFIDATGASDAVFCTGRHNTFGFPDAAVVERWQKSGARIWNTADNGEVTFWIDGDHVVARSFRPSP